MKNAIESVEHVKTHEKFHIFKDYVDFIGINSRESQPDWDTILVKIAQEEERKKEQKEKLRLAKIQ